MAVSRERINQLINQLSDQDLELITDLMERLARENQLEIPLDDEPTTQEDQNAIQAALEAMKTGDLIPLKDIEHELRG